MSSINVFLSYAHKDRHLAEAVLRQLKELPVRVSSDQDLRVGEDWGSVLKQKLEESDAVVFIVSGSTFDSSWQLEELGAAYTLGKKIIPVVFGAHLADKLPVEVQESQIVAGEDLKGLASAFGVTEEPDMHQPALER